MNETRATMNGKPVFTVPSKTIINFKSGFGHKLLCDDMTFTTGTALAMSEQLRYDRCEHVWAEVINLRGDSFTNTINRLSNAHMRVCPPEKLRFLQYTSKDTDAWWTQRGVVKL